MKLHINGEEKTYESPLTLSALVESLGMKPDRVAVELNRDIVPRDRWAATPLNEGDRLEVVHFVGGGRCPQAFCHSERGICPGFTGANPQSKNPFQL
jgi:sulfur carrier protein